MVVDTKYASRNAMLRDFKFHTNDIDIAIEIGVFRGEFSFEMINVLKPKNFYGVDPFELYEGCVTCLLYTSPSPRDLSTSRMPSSA